MCGLPILVDGRGSASLGVLGPRFISESSFVKSLSLRVSVISMSAWQKGQKKYKAA